MKVFEWDCKRLAVSTVYLLCCALFSVNNCLLMTIYDN